MHDFIQEYRSAISQDDCARLICKFQHYDESPRKRLLVEDKFTTDGGAPDEIRTKEASVIYLKPEVL